MTDRTVVVRLVANIADFRRNMADASQAAKQAGSDFEKFTTKNKQDMETVGKAGLALGTGLAVGVGLALKKFADFDQAMSNIKAATHETATNMNLLREAALQAGADTAFSAVEAADGIEALAKAGVSTTAILNGGLNGALDLAAAGGLAVGDAAEIAATALTQFKLEGAQVPHVADLLAAAAGKAQGDVSDMGMALKQAGLVASQTGLSIEETTAGLASFASAGLLGSDAGTSFKSMLQRLTPQSEEAAGLMKDLGISAYDAQGNFIGLESFAGNLQESLSGLTVEQRNSAMATIFGSDAVRAAAVLYNQGADGIAAWTDKVNDSGYAQETAAAKLDNLKGDLEAFFGSLETALIRTGEAGDGPARKLVQQATDLVNSYNELPQSAQSVVMAVGAVGAAASLAAGGFLVLAPRIVATHTALVALQTAAPRTAAAMSALGKSLGFAAVAVGAAVGVDQLAQAIADAPPGVNALTDSLADFARDGKASGDLARVVGQDFTELGDKMKAAGESKWFSLDAGTSRVEIEEARGEIEALDQALAGLVNSGNGVLAARLLTDAGVSAADAAEHFDSYKEAQAGTSAQTKLTANSQEALGGAVEGATGAVEEQTESLSDLMKQVKGLSDLVLGLRDASRGYEAALDDANAALKDNGKTLDTNTEKGRANEAALDAIASSAGEVLQGMVDTGKPISDVTAKFGQQRDALVKAAQGFGMTKDQANAYADSVLRIPPKKVTDVKLTGADAALAQVDRLRAYLAGLTNKTVTVRVDQVLGTTVARPGGGRVIEKADGGYISGSGTDTSDNIPALLSPGEYVIRAASVRKIGVPALDRINRYASGGPVKRVGNAPRSIAAATSLVDRARGMTTVEEVRALVQAWEEYNAQLEQAARREELVADAKAAKAAFDAAKGMKARTAALKELNEANSRLRDFDAAARINAERQAVNKLIDGLEAEADAREKAERAAKDLAQARKDATEAAQSEFDKALAGLNRLLDQEQQIRGQLAKSVRDFHAGQARLAAAGLEAERRYQQEQAQLRQAQAKAEGEHLQRMNDLGEQFTAEQSRIVADRRDRLANATALDQAIDFRRGLPADWLISNARAQVEALTEWMQELDHARRMGVSEAVIEALGLEEGPQALAQVRALTRASAAEVDELNRAVEDRTRTAGEQVRREQVGNFGQLGQQLVAAQQQYAAAVLQAQDDYRAGQAQFAADLLALGVRYQQDRAELAAQAAALHAEFIAEQQALTVELSQVGAAQGRAYGQALAEGMLSQVPAVRAAAKALADAMAALAAVNGATVDAPVSSRPKGSAKDTGPFKRIGLRTATYDSGGWLQPGLTLAYNGTGQPERVLTAQQAGGRTVNVMPGAQVTIRETVDVDLLARRAEFLIAAGSL